MIAQERDIGGGESLVRGWWRWGAMLREYTFYGNLCQEVSKNTVFDLEKERRGDRPMGRGGFVAWEASITRKAPSSAFLKFGRCK